MKRKKIIPEIAVIALQTLLLTGVTVLSVFPLSCKVSVEGIEVIGGDYETPVLESIAPLDELTLELKFSKAVNLNSVVISPVIPGVSDASTHSKTERLSAALAAAAGEYGKLETEYEYSQDKKTVTFTFLENTEIGQTYEIFGIVVDEIGNSLTFCAPFIGFNAEVPKVIMTEIQAKYAKASLKTGVVYRSEYVEFLALNDGNLAGIELISASDGELKKYEFPAIEVARGQVFLVHLRTIGEGCINETDNLNAATAEYSCENLLDLWSENTQARFNDSTDIIILKNTVNNSIMDAVMYAAEDSEEWKANLEEYAILLEDCGIYESEDISNATISKGMTPKKSLQRVDAKQIYDNIMADEEIEYPILSGSESWTVSDVTPGVL